MFGCSSVVWCDVVKCGVVLTIINYPDRVGCVNRVWIGRIEL